MPLWWCINSKATLFAEHLVLRLPDSPGDARLGGEDAAPSCHYRPVPGPAMPHCVWWVRSETLREAPAQSCPHSCSRLLPSGKNTAQLSDSLRFVSVLDAYCWLFLAWLWDPRPPCPEQREHGEAWDRLEQGPVTGQRKNLGVQKYLAGGGVSSGFIRRGRRWIFCLCGEQAGAAALSAQEPCQGPRALPDPPGPGRSPRALPDPPGPCEGH